MFSTENHKKSPKSQIPKNSEKFRKIPKNSEKFRNMKNSTYFENKRYSLSRFWAMNQEANEPLPYPVPSPSAIVFLGQAESPGVSQRFRWARSAYSSVRWNVFNLRDVSLVFSKKREGNRRIIKILNKKLDF